MSAFHQVLDRPKEQNSINGHGDAVIGVAFSRSGDLIAFASLDNTVKLWTVNLDDLISEGCSWVRDYLKNNPNVTEDERDLCGVEASAMALFLKGEQLAVEDNIDQAVSKFQQAVKLDPNFSLSSANLLVEKGRDLAENGKIDEAIAQFEQAEKLDADLVVVVAYGQIIPKEY